MQLTHYTSKFGQRTFPITLVCDNVSNATNLGGLLRAADAFGIEKVYFCGEKIELNRKALRTSRATEKYVDFQLNANIFEVLESLKTEDCKVIALEITSSSQAVKTFNFDLSKPIVLIIGDENFGVNESILDICDTIVHIEMFGKNSSMNVVQAVSVALYELTKQFNNE